MTKKNEITTVNNNSGFLALKDFNLGDVLGEELSGLTVAFDRIKIPSGGGTVFEIPGETEDEPETVKEFSAVILHQHALNAYYKDEYTGGSNSPDCGSLDGFFGEGSPGGQCRSCPLNQYGSGKNGAKACKNRRRLYLLREGDVFLMMLSLPTGSLKGFTRYLTRIVTRYGSSNAVVTRFTLKKASSASGIGYSQAQFMVDRPLTKDEFALISLMTEQVKALSQTVGYDSETETAAANVDPETGEITEPLV